MAEDDKRNRALAIEFYRQAGEYVKAALYSLFLLNGGAITAILAKSSLHDITGHIFWFLGGIASAVASLVTAYLSTNEIARFNGGHDLSPFGIFAPRVVFNTFFITTLFLACISLVAFFVGCITVWCTSKTWKYTLCQII